MKNNLTLLSYVTIIFALLNYFLWVQSDAQRLAVFTSPDELSVISSDDNLQNGK